MNTRFHAALAAAVLLNLRVAAAVSQEPPPAEPQAQPAQAPESAAGLEVSQPPGESTAAEPPAAEAPATGSAEADAAAPAAASSESTSRSASAGIPGAKRIVVLPVEFTVYQQSVGALEAVPEWTEAAQFSLASAAIEVLKTSGRFQVMNAPDPSAGTADLLREHVELFKLVGREITSLHDYGGKAWKGKWENFDYTLGDGLSFLADATGADYAFLVAGRQLTTSGGVKALSTLAFLASGTGITGYTHIYSGIVDLRDGAVKWFNWKAGDKIFGPDGDVRKPEVAFAMMIWLFDEYPGHKSLKFPKF